MGPGRISVVRLSDIGGVLTATPVLPRPKFDCALVERRYGYGQDRHSHR